MVQPQQSAAQQFAELVRGCVDVVRADDLRSRLDRSVATGHPLLVKVGFDPTAPDLHLGHTVLLRKMKQFQDLDHTVVFVVGDFTGMIGDPTGRSKTRPPLTAEEIQQNAETYKTQAFKLLDPAKTRLEYNSTWLSPLGAEGLVKLAGRYNVAQMLERRDFRQRYESGQPIALHEFLYSLVQAYDSVVLKADVELGGTDQLFNLNVGRDIMPSFGLEAQIVMTVPLLVGLDGVEKMSKSLGNYVGVTESSDDMFGKLMSISDTLMWRYYRLLTELDEREVAGLEDRVRTGDLHPRQAKVDLARRIVADFPSQAEADKAAAEFDRVHSRHELPADIREFSVQLGDDRAKPLTRIMVEAGLATSASDASRKVQQGGVRLNGERWTAVTGRIERASLPAVLQVGRHTLRLVAAETLEPSNPRTLEPSNPRTLEP